MRSLLFITILAYVLAGIFASPVEVIEVPENNNAQAAALLAVDPTQEGYENVGERQARQFGYGGYGGYGGYRGGYGGYRGGYGGGFGRPYGGYGGYGGYRGGYGGYGGHHGGFYG